MKKKITQDSINNFEYLKSKLCTKNLYMALDKIENLMLDITKLRAENIELKYQKKANDK